MREETVRCEKCDTRMKEVGRIQTFEEDPDNDLPANYSIFYQCPECKTIEIKNT